MLGAGDVFMPIASTGGRMSSTTRIPKAESFPVRLEPELRRAHDERAAADDTTASGVVREALRRYLKVG
jgi:hypothetical protein